MCVFKDLDLILKKIKDGNTKTIKNKWAADFFIPAFFVIFNYYKLSDHHNQFGEAWWNDGDVVNFKCAFSADGDA